MSPHGKIELWHARRRRQRQNIRAYRNVHTLDGVEAGEHGDPEGGGDRDEANVSDGQVH